MGVKILHTGDWHIGRFEGPEKDGQNARFLDICNCLDALIEETQEQRSDIAVVAGDVFHAARTWSDRGITEVETAIRYIRRIAEICPIIVMRGTPNHDGDAHYEMLKTAFKNDDNIRIITEPCVEAVYTRSGEEIQVACLPGFDRGYFRAKNPGLSAEEENEVFTQVIEDMIIGLKAQCNKDSPTVLVSHYTIAGANMESGQTAFFSKFEPVVYPATLAAADFDLVCFGHIHRPQQIEGCKNTFYCGAVSQLNFNDEGQQRGFYIHDIDEDGDVVSTFHELPTREFATIRLEDDDVREINEGGADWLYKLPALEDADGVRDKIVRVIYNCTDEHNKAFNHAALEKWLREVGGAFWVQEITPQKITITVDRRSMDADSTPEGNLTDYLTEKGIDADQIGELVELARPIIAEATEKATTERRNGLFVPVEIEVKNYRNYREEKFSFEDIRFCTINGSNGVGKSSLFMDAMVDALFEEPREGELTGWICNDPDARSGSIKFTFRLGETLYRVTRTRQKSGKATLNISEFVDGEWADRSKEKFKDTQAEIENIIGMDSLTLKACALIMQDQYGLFLQADKEARMNILGNILGLGIYADMEDLAAGRATDTNREVRLLLDRINTITDGLPDVTALEIQAAEAERSRAEYERAAAARTADIDRLKVKINTQLEAAGRVLKLNGKITGLTAKKASKESVKTVQMGAVTAANAILESEAEIAAGVARYNGLLEQEKELIKGKAVYDSLVARKTQLEAETAQAQATADEQDGKKAALTASIKALEAELTREAELTEKHKEYTETAKVIADMEALEPEYNAKKAACESARLELQTIEYRHKIEKEKLEQQRAALEKKVKLLEESNCPIAEKANCRFLTDAIAAKTELPEVEERIFLEEEEYRQSREKNAQASSEALKDLDNTSYQPDKIMALRATLRQIEAFEREYAGLDAKRSKLKLLTERVEEYDKAIAEAKEAEAKSREELSGVEAQITEVTQAAADYDRLKTEIAAEKAWTVKEKQLPAAREMKKAAEQRIAELTDEIAALEAEIAESRAELAEEQSKTVGTEELQARVTAAETEVKQLKDAAQELSLKIGGLQTKIEQTRRSQEQAAALQGEANKLSVTAAGYEELKRAFSQDGIPHNIIRSIIPIFEATATNILGQMSGGKMSVELVTEKTLKSNNKKEVTTLDVIISDAETGRLPYMSRSGGERVKAALSVILALSEIKQTKAGVQFGFLFIDEPAFLDQAGTQAYCDALEAIQTRYPKTKVIAITHDESFKARFPQSVTVYKDESGSHVRSD